MADKNNPTIIIDRFPILLSNKSMIKKLIIFCIFVLSIFPIYANEIRIPFGNNENQVGVLKTSNDFWFPRFFGVDEKNNIYIPDFYKHRISVFSSNGEFVKAIPAANGLRPDMNYFNIVNGNFFVTFGASVLYILDSNGELIFSYNFGIGQFPDTIICTDSYVFVVMPSYKVSQGFSIVFNYSNPEPIGLYGKIENEQPVPLFTLDNKIAHPVFLKASDASRINYTWLGVTSDNSLVWYSDKNEGKLIIKRNTLESSAEEIRINFGTADSFRTIRLDYNDKILVMDYSDNGYIIRDYPVR